MKNIYIKIVSVIAYIVMVMVNFLANSLPINNRSTGEISDQYLNLFAPAGITFSIWGLIYLLLGAYVFFQFVKKDEKKEALNKKISPLFIGTSLANISWILAWHYDFIGLSVVIMLTLLVLLIKIADLLRGQHFNFMEKIFLQAPFSVYFGWITVATIANITVFLVSSGWNGFGIPDFIWTSIVLLVGCLIGILRMRHDQNIAYGLVLLWAYAGILLKHLSVTGFNKQYPSVIITVIFCLFLFLFFVGKIFYKKRAKLL